MTTELRTNEPAEGIWTCKVLSAKAGDDAKGLYTVQINIELTEGSSKGRRMTYEQTVDARSAPYVGSSAKAVGWKGATLATLSADCDAWAAATGGTSTVEVKRFAIKNEERKAKMIARGEEPIFAKANAIGRGSKPVQAPKPQSQKDADDAMRAAMGDTGGWAGDAPAVAPPEDDIPFASCAISADVNPIAAVLR